MAFLAVLLMFTMYYLIANSGTPAVGFWQDDGIYLCTAKSLAEGRGYRHIEIPGEPLQTKYPILYPALLSLIFRIAPHYPQNLFLLLVPTAMAAAGSVFLSAVYYRRVFAASSLLCLMAACLASFSPAIASFVRFTMSDLLFGFLSIAALVSFDAYSSDAAHSKRRIFWLVLSALCGALAILTRTIGFSLVAALMISCFQKKNLRGGAVILLVLLLCLAPWFLWQMTAARSNGSLQNSVLDAPELSYAIWLPHRLGEWIRVIWQNTIRTVFGVGFFQLVFPAQWTFDALAEFSYRTICLYVIFYGSTLLILVGFIRSAYAGWRTVHSYAIIYLALMLAWPFEPFRFLIPWTPFLLYFLLYGIQTAAGHLDRCLGFLTGERFAQMSLWAAGLVLGMSFISEDYRIVSSTGENFYARETQYNGSEIREVERWLLKSVSPGEVVASDRPAGLYLTTGIKGLYFWPDTNPYSLYYGRERQGWKFYMFPVESESECVYAQLQSQFAASYGAADVRYYVEHTGANAQTHALEKLISEKPEWFELLWNSPQNVYRIYRIKSESWAKP